MCPARHRSRRRLSARIIVCSLALLIAAGAAIIADHELSRSSGKSHVHESEPSTAPTSTSTTVPPSAATSTTVVAPPRPIWRIAWGSAMAWGYGIASNVTVRELTTIAIFRADHRVDIHVADDDGIGGEGDAATE